MVEIGVAWLLALEVRDHMKEKGGVFLGSVWGASFLTPLIQNRLYPLGFKPVREQTPVLIQFVICSSSSGN